MTKKMQRDRKPTPVADDVVAEMDVRMAYQNLIENFAADQQALEVRIQSAEGSADADSGTPKAPD